MIVYSKTKRDRDGMAAARVPARSPTQSLYQLIGASVPQPVGGWNWNDSWKAAVCAILEHEFSVDLYHGVLGYLPAQARAIMGQTTFDHLTDAERRSMHERHKHGDAQIRALFRQAQAFQDSYGDVNFTPADLARVKARTLIVHGDQDPLYPISIPAELHAAIAGSRVWIVPNGGHCPIFGDMADPFVEIALPFLRGEWLSASD